MKLLFFTGSRSEWGYIRPILHLCKKKKIPYKICCTNMHLLKRFGSSIDEIKKDGFQVEDEIYMSLDGYNSYTMTKSLGILIRSIHINLPIIILIIVSCGSKTSAIIHVLFLLFVVFMYIIFNGCILSMLEERLCKEQYILVDPFIELSGLEINYKNRKSFTLWIMSSHVIIVFLIFYFRFIR